MKDLMEMLSTRRPAGSTTEKNFIRQWIKPLPGIEQDDAGNLYCRIGTEPILWSCHTDTVHNKEGFQVPSLDKGWISLAPFQQHVNCLGADDTAGVWLMVNMIRERRPGLYIFHRAEECGGIGSHFIRKHRTNTLAGIKYAIALDRFGTNSIITHQFGRCCSDQFADSLAEAMPTLDLYADSGGVFTDTANYADIIPECTNLSVGYKDHHTRSESLNVDHLSTLLAALLDLDTDSLVSSRDPLVDDELETIWTYDFDQGLAHPPLFSDLEDLLRDYPGEVAAVLEQYGLTPSMLIDDMIEGGLMSQHGYAA
jgi:hypothetical protein